MCDGLRPAGLLHGARLNLARRPLESARRYRATGWASLGEADGPPAWDVVADHLRSLERVRLDARSRVRVL